MRMPTMTEGSLRKPRSRRVTEMQTPPRNSYIVLRVSTRSSPVNGALDALCAHVSASCVARSFR